MDKIVDSRGVSRVTTDSAHLGFYSKVEAVIHHELSPEDQGALVSLVERCIVAAVEGFARV